MPGFGKASDDFNLLIQWGDLNSRQNSLGLILFSLAFVTDNYKKITVSKAKLTLEEDIHMDAKDIIEAAKVRIQKYEPRRTIIEELNVEIARRDCLQDLHNWAELFCYRASVRIVARDPEKAAEELKPFVGKGRLLADNPKAHTNYANALVHSGRSKDARAHLWPLLQEGQILADNRWAHAIYAKALIGCHLSDAAAAFLDFHMQKGRVLEGNEEVLHIYAKAMLSAGAHAAQADASPSSPVSATRQPPSGPRPSDHSL